MHRQILVPTEKNHSINLPPDMYGKQVEIIAFTIEPLEKKPGKKTQFLDDIGIIPDFPSVQEIHKNAWPEKW